MRTASESQFEFGYLPALDGLRGLAIFFVLVGHVFQFSLNRWQSEGNGFGQLGVMLFFVLSGFLITSLLYRERTASGTINLKRFYLRRVLRLGPALVVFLLVMFLLIALKLITDVPAYELAVCLLYVRNIFGRSHSLGHLWSLSMEEQFYAIWPLAMSFLQPRTLLRTGCVLVVGCTAFRMAAIGLNLFPYATGVYYERPYFRFDSILLGCCLSLVLLMKPGASGCLRKIVSAIPWPVAWSCLLAWTLWCQEWSHPLYINRANAWFSVGANTTFTSEGRRSPANRLLAGSDIFGSRVVWIVLVATAVHSQ